MVAFSSSLILHLQSPLSPRICLPLHLRSLTSNPDPQTFLYDPTTHRTGWTRWSKGASNGLHGFSLQGLKSNIQYNSVSVTEISRDDSNETGSTIQHFNLNSYIGFCRRKLRLFLLVLIAMDGANELNTINTACANICQRAHR